MLLLKKLVERCPGASVDDVVSRIVPSSLTGPSLVTALENGSPDIALLYAQLPATPGLEEKAALVQPGTEVAPAGWVMSDLLAQKPKVAAIRQS